MRGHTTFDHPEVAALFGRCQVLVGRFGEVPPAALVAEVRGLVAGLPASPSRAEQIVIRGILGHLLARFVRIAGIDDRADVTAGFLNLANAGLTIDAWRLQWFHVTDCCAALLHNGIDSYQIIDTRVTRMLRFVQMRHVSSKLTMREVAQTINVCSRRWARILKQQTGFGFLEHLHRCRINVARRLLNETVLSIKEVAAKVGYAHPSQLSRQFKLACGETPLAFRAARINRRHCV
jgi:AraC-like DNA-binding protein